MKNKMLNKKGLWVLIFILMVIIAVYQLNLLNLLIKSLGLWESP